MKIRSTMCAVFGAVLAFAYAGAAFGEASGTVTVDADKPGIKISPVLYGMFFEEINRAGDGGLYAEMVQNRSFEDADQPKAWSIVSEGGAEAAMAQDKSQPLNDANPRSVRLTISKAGDGSAGRAGIANSGFGGGMPVKRSIQYLLSFYARGGGDGFDGAVTASLEAKDGARAYAKHKFPSIGKTWQQYTCTLTAEDDDPAARLVLSTTTSGSVCFDMVSLFPRNTWKERPNGLRADLGNLLAELKLSFVRFPGGCFVEGDILANAFRWKNTLGDSAARPGHWNLWGYRSTDGLGYHEYLQMCEDLGAEPLFVINCGMSHKENVPLEKMSEFVQDALDAIEYANGPADSKWGALRAKAGHPAPFNLKYMEIGNENGGRAYNERYALFYDAIKAKYPQMRLVANEWSGRPGSRPIDIVDEHYYNSPEFFMAQAGRYDKYDRKGPKIYVGEYAVTQGCGRGNLRAAVGEAAFMTGMERNSDVVVMASYAPLFVRTDTRQWNPDLINFDNTRSYGTPSYYVQKMFSENRGDVVLPTQISASSTVPVAVNGSVGVGTWLTQAEFKDVKIQRGEFEYRFILDDTAKGFKTLRGQWKVQDGVYRQTTNQQDCRSVFGDTSWTDYTYTLKARKIAGAEGFLILFRVRDDGNYTWWNLGGWGNARHAIEFAQGGGKSILGSQVPGRIETGRWYDIKIELKGRNIRCYLDGKLMHEAEYPQMQPLYAVASRATAGGDVIVKLVNASAEPVQTQLDVRGLKSPPASAIMTLLTSASPLDENSLTEPKRIAPVQKALAVNGASLPLLLPGNSVAVVRIK